MTQFVGRMRCTDRLQLRTNDEEIEEAIGTSSSAPERKPSVMERQLAGDLSTQDDEEVLTPIEQFRRASDRRHGIVPGAGR